jgi:type II secretory pathway component PulF
VTLRQRIRFYQQIAVLLRAGLPIRASIDRLRERVRGPELVILSRKVGDGERLGEAFAAANFLPFESNLVAAGERSGQLETVFEHIAQFWQRELEFRQALVQPLIYPIIVVNLAVVLGSGIELVTISWPVVLFHLIVRLAVLYAAGMLLFLVARFTWSSPEMKRFWLFVPIIGRALRAAFAYRWITALRLEFGAGVSLYRAVNDAWCSSGFVDCEKLGKEGEEAMRAGASLSGLVAKWKQLPRDWVDFIETGEVSGGFDDAFRNLEAEAARNWTLAQQRMSIWIPKLAYFVALLIAAIPVIQVAKQVMVDPITNALNENDNAGR